MSRNCTSARPNQAGPAPAGRFAAAAVLLLIWIVLAGCGLTGAPPADGGEEEGVPVQVEEAHRRTLTRSITFTGTTAANNEIHVMAQVAGEVEQVPVEVGQWVEAGALLAVIRPDSLRQQVDQAAAGVEMARAGLADAQQAYEAAQREFDRMAPLYESGAVSQQQWEQMEDNLNRARLAAQVQAPAQLQQAEAALAMARSQLDKARVTAPMAGEVASVMTSVGNLAAPGNPLVTLVDRMEVKITGILSDRQVVLVQEGMAAQAVLGALEGRVFEGSVTTVAPAAQAQAGGFPVTVRIPNPEGILRPGMFAEVSIPVEDAADVVAIPVDAVLHRDGEAVVFVASGDRVEERVVDLGLSDGSWAAVLDGLEEGEQVVVTGQHFLADGMKVRIQARSDAPDRDTGGPGEDESS